MGYIYAFSHCQLLNTLSIIEYFQGQSPKKELGVKCLAGTAVADEIRTHKFQAAGSLTTILPPRHALRMLTNDTGHIEAPETNLVRVKE